jgi:hypothetical protein
MLTLSDPLRIAQQTVYRDVAYQGGQRQLTTKFYVMPDAPRLARDDAGGPAFRFLWYRSFERGASGDATTTAGGMLTVTVTLAPDPAGLLDLRKAIAEAANLTSPDAVELLPIPLVSGTVALSFAAETANGDFAGKVAGNGPASLTGSGNATFAVELTQDGAALLATALQKGLDILNVRYDLVFEYHLDAIKLRVWCDLSAANQTVTGRLAAGPLSIGQMRELFVANNVAGIEITAGADMKADQTQLEKTANQLLETMLANSRFGPGGATSSSSTGGQGSNTDGAPLRPVSMSENFSHTFTESVAAQQEVGLSVSLALSCSAGELADRLLQLDVSGAMKPLQITAICSADLSAGLVGSVHLWITYRAKTQDGATIDQSGDFLLKPGATQWVFRVNATADQRSYTYRATVFYKDGSTVDLGETTSDATVLVLDVDALGVLDVTAMLGDVPMGFVKSASVSLEYPPRQLATTLALDGTNASQNWQVVAGERDIAAYRYRTTWQTADGHRITDDWREGTVRRLFLDAPRGLDASLTVQVIAAGDFSQLTQLILDLRAGSAADADSAQHTFSRPGESFTWKLKAAPGSALRYQARRTMVQQDGTVRVLDWTDETTPVLVVRDVLRFDVQIVPRLLDLGGAWTLAVLDFDFEDDSASIHEQDSVILHDKSAEARWSFRVASPDRHKYRYRLNLVSKDGAKQINPWQETDSEVLVLQP